MDLDLSVPTAAPETTDTPGPVVHETCELFVSDNFLKQASLLFLNFYDIFQHGMTAQMIPFFHHHEQQGTSFVFFGNQRPSRPPQIRSRLHTAATEFCQRGSMMWVLVPPDNKYRIPNTNLLRLLETYLDMDIVPQECVVCGSNAGMHRKSDADRAFAYNCGIPFIPFQFWHERRSLQPWKWRASFPSIEERRQLLAQNQEKTPPPLHEVLSRHEHLQIVFITGPPRSGKHTLASLLTQEKRARGWRVQFAVDDYWFPLERLQDLSVLVLEVELDLNLCRVLNMVKVQRAPTAATRVCPETAFLRWAERQRSLTQMAFPAHIVYPNRLDVRAQPEFFFHY